MSHPLRAPGAPCHFDFHVNDFEKASAFFGELFRWQFNDYLDTEKYVKTGTDTPCGCAILGEARANNSTIVYINVENIAHTLERVSQLDGKVLEQENEIPGGHGFLGKFVDPFGNTWGLYRPAEVR